MDEPTPPEPPAPDAPAAEPAPARPSIPGTVLAVVIPACIGGGWQAVTKFATTQVADDPGARLWAWVSCLIGLLFVGLGVALYRRRRWARTTFIVLSAIGTALGVLYAVTGSTAYGLQSIIWSTVYLILLSTPSARSWFRRPAGPTPESAVVA